MFSNGTEYGLFLEHHCFRCKHYVHYEDGAPCPTEEALAFASIDESVFPTEDMNFDSVGRVAGCKKFESGGEF